MSPTTEEQTVSQLIPLVNEIFKEVRNNNLSAREVSNVFSQLIQEKNRTERTFFQFDDDDVSTSNATNLKKREITSAEISNLWTQYMANSMSVCVYQYFLKIVEDPKIKSIAESAYEAAQKNLTTTLPYFEQSNHKAPIGFTNDDVNLNAPRLFSDAFILHYTEIMLIHAISGYAIAISTCESKDIRKHFVESANLARDLFEKTIDLSKSRGEFIPSPTIPPLEGSEFIQIKGGFSNLVGEKQPLMASEIENIFFNLKKTHLTRALSLAFRQVAQSKDVRNYLTETDKLIHLNARTFSSILEEDNLPTPKIWDAEITNSTVSPFSDKLMMLHDGFLTSAALAYYGTAMASSVRADISVAYSKAISNVLKCSNKWLTIVVKNEWLERQPHAIDRNHLYNANH